MNYHTFFLFVNLDISPIESSHKCVINTNSVTQQYSTHCTCMLLDIINLWS